jgi:hypothetical protein
MKHSIRNTKYQILTTRKAFTLIEALTLLFIFSLITVTFYNVISVGTRYIQDSKNRLGALAVANEKMEAIRNLKYEDIGTVGGDVSGNIPMNETVSENAHSFGVHTDVQYVEDDFDGNSSCDPTCDSAFEDYKKVTVAVSWGDGSGGSQVQMSSRFVSPSLEVANPGDGILVVNVFSDQPGGTGIPDSTVHIYNPDTGLNTERETDSSGSVSFIGDTVTDSIQKYEITVSKDDYETVSTLPPYPASTFNPTFTHASVVTGSVNVANIVQNKLANFKVLSVDHLNVPISNINFSVTGGKIIGTDVTYPNGPIFNFSATETTDGDGEKIFSGISPGPYSPVPSATDYELIGFNPSSPLTVYPNQDNDISMVLAAKNTTSLLVTVLDQSDETPISGASVKVTNGFGYDVTVTTNSQGKAFFPTDASPFLGGSYTTEVSASGFSAGGPGTAIVTDNQLKTDTIHLTAS